jgi:hypothetical protein
MRMFLYLVGPGSLEIGVVPLSEKGNRRRIEKRGDETLTNFLEPYDSFESGGAQLDRGNA